ncbi:MAG: hypothetical protein AAB295_06255 [Chloroflexota bacterium]
MKKLLITAALLLSLVASANQASADPGRGAPSAGVTWEGAGTYLSAGVTWE